MYEKFIKYLVKGAKTQQYTFSWTGILLSKICAASSGLKCLILSVFDLSILNLLELDSNLSPCDMSIGIVATLDNALPGMSE